MSKLYLSESGNVIPTLCEELTVDRKARKVLDLPPTNTMGTLYFLACSHKGSRLPLHLAVNGTELTPIPPEPPEFHHWHEVPLKVSLLKSGANTFEFWTDATAMNAWSLAMEDGHANPRSFLSDDGGITWRNEKMGYLNVMRAEFVVRVRLAEGEDPSPPSMVWENPVCSRIERLRRLLPPKALQHEPLLERVRALTSWISSSWEHTSTDRAAQYAPWDAETILAWGRTRSGHNGQVPIAMCVHYTVVFVSCTQAVGIPARCAILLGTPNGSDGHFVAEVWSENHNKWIMVDPNLDAIVQKNGVPLSITEIQETGSKLESLIKWGRGSDFQRQNPRIVKFIQDIYQTGRCFQHRSLWPRTDFLSHPEQTPPGHGALSYCESGLVWEKRDLQRGFGMFPHFADATYFDAPPPLNKQVKLQAKPSPAPPK